MDILPVHYTFEEKCTITKAIEHSERRRNYNLARSLRRNWEPRAMSPSSETSPSQDFVTEAIMPDSTSATPTSPTAMRVRQRSRAASRGDTSETYPSAIMPNGEKTASSDHEKFKERCAVLEKEREDKDKLIRVLLKELATEREAHEILKRGVEGLGKELDFVDKLVYTMEDELSSVYDLLARSKQLVEDGLVV